MEVRQADAHEICVRHKALCLLYAVQYSIRGVGGLKTDECCVWAQTAAGGSGFMHAALMLWLPVAHQNEPKQNRYYIYGSQCKILSPVAYWHL